MRPYLPALAREGRRLEIKRGRARGISPTGARAWRSVVTAAARGGLVV